MTAALYQQQSGTLPWRGWPLKAIWFQPSLSLYPSHPTREDQRSPSPTQGPGPITPHSGRSNPKSRCNDPVAVRFATSKRLPPNYYLETAQSPTQDLVYQLSLVVQDHHVKVLAWTSKWSGYVHGSSRLPTGAMQQLVFDPDPPLRGNSKFSRFRGLGEIWQQGPQICSSLVPAKCHLNQCYYNLSPPWGWSCAACCPASK